LPRREYVRHLLQNPTRPGRVTCPEPWAKATWADATWVEAFAPINMALVKYWGKRDPLLNLPTTPSVSLTFPEWGTSTRISWASTWSVCLNGQLQPWGETAFSQRLQEFLELFDLPQPLGIETTNTLPTASGLASSASGYAALVKALNILCGWGCGNEDLSRLARLGSGSACRSLWPGFVRWNPGSRDDGLDSHGVPLDIHWPELRAGIVIVEGGEKSIGSRKAMALTQQTSPLYTLWPQIVAQDLDLLHQALAAKDFPSLGHVTENQAVMLHALMATSAPPLVYTTPETWAIMASVRALREHGTPVYFTQDAGHHLCLLFLQESEAIVRQTFPSVRITVPFPTVSSPQVVSLNLGP